MEYVGNGGIPSGSSARRPRGGWNVGILGYFNGRIINLDGLMNDQIYQYALSGTVEQYIDQAEIRYLVDFPNQIEDPKLSEVQPFEGKSVMACLRPNTR